MRLKIFHFSWAGFLAGLAILLVLTVFVGYLLLGIYGMKHFAAIETFKETWLGLWGCYCEQEAFPPHQTVSSEGLPLHSWRVQILPYVGCKELYAKIRLDEPWNSEWNRQFYSQMPYVFRNPNRTLDPAKGETTYCLIVGGGSFVPESGGVPKSDWEARQKNSGRLILAEGGPFCWMDPNGDLRFEDVIQGIGAPGGILREEESFPGRVPVLRRLCRRLGIGGIGGGVLTGRVGGNTDYDLEETLTSEEIRKRITEGKAD